MDLRNFILTVLSGILQYATAGSDGVIGPREFCHNEAFIAECPSDEVIVMTTALYGRMHLGRCVRTDFGFVGCYTDVMELVERRCSGRRRCEIRVPDPIFDDTRPCNEDLKSYLEASYKCVKVLTGDTGLCKASNHIRVTVPHGYLASLVTKETTCGADTSPWVIQGQAGQRINLTLFDYTPRLDSNKAMEAVTCLKYATVRDGASRRQEDICGGIPRDGAVFTSLSHNIEVKVNSPGNYYFLLKFEVMGCPDIKAPENTWVKRHDNRLTIGCPGSTDKWHLVCRGVTWYGNVGNCTKDETEGTPHMMFGEMSFPMGISVLIIILVALGIGGTILVLGLLALKRRTARSRARKKNGIPLREAKPLSDPCSDADMIRMTSLTPKEYHKDPKLRKGLDAGDSEYSYVWDCPENTTCAPEIVRDKGLRYDATFPRSCVNTAGDATWHTLSRFPSTCKAHQASHCCDLNPDVILTKPGPHKGPTVELGKHLRYPDCQDCDQKQFSTLKPLH